MGKVPVSFAVGLSLIVATLAIAPSVRAESFQNLGFENVQMHVNGTASVEDWLDNAGDTLSVAHEFHCIETCSLLVDDQKSAAIDGNFSLFLYGGTATIVETVDVNGEFVVVGQQEIDLDASITQFGDVPADANTITILAMGPISILMNGTDIPLTAVGSDNGATELAGDVASFAGSPVELEIVTHEATIDLLSFSGLTIADLSIPEPSSLLLFGMGIGILSFRTARTRCRQPAARA